MVALDVGSFEKNLAEEAFESTLEVIASLCLRLDQMSLAVGFLTNGAAQGSDASSVHPGRGSRQLSAILEILGRLQMRNKTGLTSIMQQIPRLLRGVSWAYFCYEIGRQSDEMRTFCKKRHIPINVFAWRLNPASAGIQDPEMADVHWIKNIRLSEENPA